MKTQLIKTKHLFWLLALITAVLFDQLFWEKQSGINFFLFITAAGLGGLIPMWIEKIFIPWASYLLLIPVLLFGSFTFIRSEPLTTLMNVLLTLGSLILFAIALRNGAWFKYDFKEHIINFLNFLLHGLIGGVLFFIKIKADNGNSNEAVEPARSQNETKKGSKNKKAMPYLRGFLLALPLLIVFSLLLAAADPVFGAKIFGVFDWFEFDQFGEYLFRSSYILAIAYLLLGVYFFGLVKSRDLHKQTEEESQQGNFLGMTEASMILGAVNLLFLSFVLVQFAYFFGGDQNITLEGFTYAEYARRGFFEMLAVAVISGFMFYVLSRITERKEKKQRWIFTGLGLALVALVAIILISAYLRLNLYEDAYGFTRLRTFTHVFMIWTGAVLVSLGVLEVTRKMKHLPVILILSLMVFGLSINILNVDRFIVQQNVQRAVNPNNEAAEDSFDSDYLAELSYDSIPPLTAYYREDQLPEDLRQEIGGTLACRLELLNQPDPGWTSWHYARSKAVSQLKNLEEALSDYRVYQSEDPWGRFVEINQVTYPCSGSVD